MKLTQLIAAWEELHVKDTGDMGFCDLEMALAKAGVDVVNDVADHMKDGRGAAAWTRVMSISFVGAPLCERCGVVMTRYDATRWVCPNDDCDLNTRPKSVPGIFPVEVGR